MSSAAVTPPTAVITPTDHGGLITICAACGMTFALISVLIRIYARDAINAVWSRDDTALAISALLCLGQSVAKMVAVNHGLGKTINEINPAELMSVRKSNYASDLLFVWGLYFSKVSAVFLFLRLTPNKLHVRACWIIMGMSTVWITASTFTVALRCHLLEPWTMDEKCTNMLVRWRVLGSLDIVTEIALFSMAIYLVRDLRMPFQLKVFVVSAFAFRLPVIVFTLLRIYYLQSELRTADPTFNGTLASIWMQVQIDYSVMACTIPCLKPFMVACNTGWGRTRTRTGTASTPLGGSYGLKSLEQNPGLESTHSYKHTAADRPQPHQNHSYSDDKGDPTHKKQRKSRANSGTAIDPNQEDPNGADETSQSVTSNDSTQMIIRREVVWTVTYEDGDSPENNHTNHNILNSNDMNDLTNHQSRISHRTDIEAQTQSNNL